MSQIDKNIAYNLKRIRKSRNLSLDMLAERTGVSKSMLGQIERGESNPTVATVSKIMEGIKVPFEELIYRQEEQILEINREKLSVYKEKEGEYRIQVVFPYSRERNFELFLVEVEPGGCCPGNACGENTWAYMIMCGEGAQIFIEEERYELCKGNSLRFPAFKEYRIINNGEERTELYLIISHGEGKA